MADYTLKQLTQQPWLNLYEASYAAPDGRRHRWLMCSRKQRPIADAACPDAVVIVPVLPTQQGRRLVLTSEFRIALNDWEYGFPAGLIDPGESIEQTVRRELKEETGLDTACIHHLSMPVYSSAGLTDESCIMALVTAAGVPSTALNAPGEQIRVHLLDVPDIRALLAANKKIAAKAWGLLYHFAACGQIAFADGL
ncbi:MAG TPA: NUDIX hydrolase [Anaerohalosphaeraceae bacterium]|nr:NUDIX hydrolase [Phycisphaerae bacterium]HOL32614.1 NUDIX hydrolase [Anaerohalosphaeraceae bacterium]HOM76596.1 NUDIX hydrolase [Anaerohalosphaeraceae bacterium]HPC64020.1 NUDIX hydrolase [Anaerohalosphaeraceae bacterium]HPO70309.1 NUDIX hydrolase [Anaerohalosphaeraceae bacterium]